MKYEKSGPIFVIILLLDLFLYLLARTIQIPFVSENSLILFLAVVVAGTFWFLSATRRGLRKSSTAYYVFHMMVGVIVMAFLVVAPGVLPSYMPYLLVFAALIAVFLLALDFHHRIADLYVMFVQQKRKNSSLQKNHEAEIKKREQEKNKLNNDLEKLSKKLEDSESKAAKRTEDLKKQVAQKTEELKKKMAEKAQELKKKQTTIATLKKETAKTSKELTSKERALQRAKKDEGKQVELKQKYAKSLYNIRKKKKEDEELLVVSQDGNSVHDPSCIAVRNIAKENRKLIKNWNAAKKEGYKGCKLCNPHKKEEIKKKKGTKYKFVGSKESDKIHKIGCMLVDNIEENERQYFRNYKQALAKGYTSCRICNPGQ